MKSIFFNTYSSFTRARRLGLAGKISIKPEDVRRFHAILSAPVDETENIHSVGAPSKMTVASDGFDGMLQGQKSVPAYDDGDDDEAALWWFFRQGAIAAQNTS